MKKGCKPFKRPIAQKLAELITTPKKVTSFRDGTLCYHEVYGYGKIEFSDGTQCRIRFEKGFCDYFNITNLSLSPRFALLMDDQYPFP